MDKADPDLPRLREVLRLLKKVELLADAAAAYVETDVMKAAIQDLHFQRASVWMAIYPATGGEDAFSTGDAFAASPDRPITAFGQVRSRSPSRQRFIAPPRYSKIPLAGCRRGAPSIA